MATSLTAFAQTTANFTGAVDSVWETPGNWSTSTGASLPPSSADTAAFSAGGTAVLSADTSVNRITVSTSPVTLQGSGVLRTITLAGTLAPSITTGLTLDRVKLSKGATAGALNLTGSVNFVNGGAIDWSGTSTFTANTILANVDLTGTGSLTINSGSSLTVTGGRTFSLASGVAFTSAGAINANQGTISIGSSSGSLGGTIQYGSGQASTVAIAGSTSVAALTVNTSGSNGGSDFFQITGTLTKTGSGALSFNNTSGGAYTVSNSGDLVLGGSGTVTFNVALNQSAGTLNFGGSTVVLNQTATITGGSVIGGLATSSGSGAFNLTGATLSPGASAGQVGSIALPAALGLNGGTLSIDINGNSSADAVTAGGVVTLAGSPTLAVTAPNGIAYSTAFTILSGSGLGGTFAGLNNNDTLIASGAANQQFRINYSGNAVTLTAVPEPRVVAAAVGFGLVGFAALRRRRTI